MRIDSQGTPYPTDLLNLSAGVGSTTLPARRLQETYSGTDKYKRAGAEVIVSFESRQGGSASERVGADYSGDYSRLLKASSSPQGNSTSTASSIIAAETAYSAQGSAQPIRTDHTGKVNKVEREYGLSSRDDGAKASSSKTTFKITA